ncbi:MAG: hypothetical protein U0075_23575 [Thermomicrobiales bacterium]
MGTLQPLQSLQRHAQVARKAVELVDDDNVEEASLGISQQLLKSGTLGEVVGARAAAFVPVDSGHLPAMGFAIVAAGPVLSIEGVALDLFFA